MLTHKERLQRRKEIAEAIECEKLSLSQTARKFKVSVNSVYVACVEFDVRLPPQVGKKKNTSYQAIALRQKGFTHQQIAEQLNVSHQRIQQIISSAKDAGVLGLDVSKKKTN